MTFIDVEKLTAKFFQEICPGKLMEYSVSAGLLSWGKMEFLSYAVIVDRGAL